MEIANGYLGTCHGCSFLGIKRYVKGPELDTGSLGDFFGIDDLFDFSNEEIGVPTGEACPIGAPLEATSGETSNWPVETKSSYHVPGPMDATGPGDICVPCDDVAELEWLSNFVEESFSSADATMTLSNSGLDPKHGEHTVLFTESKLFGSTSPISVLESSACSTFKIGSSNPEVSVPGRARSKRSRHGVCFWNSRILSATDISASRILDSFGSTVPATAVISPGMDKLAAEHGVTGCLSAKKLKNTPGKSKKVQEAGQARRCVHCGIQRTPQWRAGPMGPKTLCNACGVRYKSGRLLPEYRPAASPTFVGSMHSNSHRKVLELRRQREVAEVGVALAMVEEDEEEAGGAGAQQDD